MISFDVSISSLAWMSFVKAIMFIINNNQAQDSFNLK